MVDNESVVTAIVVVITVSVALLVGIVIIDATGDTIAAEDRSQSVTLGEAGEFVEIESFGTGTDETVLNSRGNAAQFTGANDSYVSLDAPIGLNLSANFTVSQPVWINESATGETMTVLALGNGDLLLRYDGSVPQWQVWLYRPPNDIYVANVSASDPANASVVQLRRADDTLTIYENNSAGESADLSSSASSSIDPDASNLQGRLDETRVYQANLSHADGQSLVDQPVRPVGIEEDARVLYDELEDSAFSVYFAGGSATASNVTLADGFAGEEMDEDGLIFSGDYEWRERGPQIAVVDGERLDGHPVAFVDYSYNKGGGMLAGIKSAFDLSAVLPVVLVASAAFVVILRLRE